MKQLKEFLIEHDFLETYCKLIVDPRVTQGTANINNSIKYHNMLTALYVFTLVEKHLGIDESRLIKLDREWTRRTYDIPKPIDIHMDNRQAIIDQLLPSKASIALRAVRNFSDLS
jgi:hypothetical protein